MQAISEACNNAIEHAYRGASGPIRLLLEHRVGALEIAVEDHGSWRSPDPSPERGRGLQIMRALMHETGIEREHGGDARAAQPAARSLTLKRF